MDKKNKEYKEWFESLGLKDNGVVIIQGEGCRGMSLMGAYLAYQQRKLFPKLKPQDPGVPHV